MKKSVLLAIIGIVMSVAVGCSGGIDSKSDKQKDEKNIGDTGTYEYENVTFSYRIGDAGAIIESVTPDYGKTIKFPDYVDNYEVVEVHRSCKIEYEEVYMPSTIEKIEIGLFTENKVLKYIDVKNVTYISPNAFKKCVSLETVVGNEIQHIGIGAFGECTSLKNISLSNVIKIDKEAFVGCTALQTIDISNVEAIGESAFAGCAELNCNIEFKKLKLQAIGSEAFSGCVGLNAKTITFEQKQEMLEGDIWTVMDRVAKNKYFYGTGVEFEGIDSAYTPLLRGEGMRCIIYSFSPNGFGDSASVGSIDTCEITCSGREFYDSVSEVFSNRVIKNGESLSVKDLSDIINKLKDDGNITDMAPFELSASKYRFVDALAILLEGYEPYQAWGNYDDNVDFGIDKEIVYDEVGNTQYRYKALKDDMQLTNTSGGDIYFEVDEYYEDEEGVDFYISVYTTINLEFLIIDNISQCATM